MKFKKETLRKIIQEELQAVLSEQKTQYNFKLLDKVMLSKNRLGRFKKCETGGGFIGLKMGCMGKDVATMQALINKWFEKNVPEAKEWQEKTGKAIIDVDGLYGKDTAQALAFIYNEKEPGPVMRRSYDVGVDRKIATSLESSDINNVEREVAMVTDPKAMVARKSGEELKDVDTALAKAKFDDQKPTATPPGKEDDGVKPIEVPQATTLKRDPIDLRNPEKKEKRVNVKLTNESVKNKFQRFL